MISRVRVMRAGAVLPPFPASAALWWKSCSFSASLLLARPRSSAGERVPMTRPRLAAGSRRPCCERGPESRPPAHGQVGSSAMVRSCTVAGRRVRSRAVIRACPPAVLRSSCPALSSAASTLGRPDRPQEGGRELRACHLRLRARRSDYSSSQAIELIFQPVGVRTNWVVLRPEPSNHAPLRKPDLRY